MKTNFKKLALAAATTAAVAGSMNASAVIQGVPGEANLVPFVYYNGSDASLGTVDTVFRLTVPQSIGYDVVFQFTAPNTVPSAPANASESLDIQQGLAAGSTTSGVHWFFMSTSSTHIQNGNIAVTADDVVTTSASTLLGGSGSARNGVPGYFIWTTEAARLGYAPANFAFYVDAFMTFGSLSTPAAPAIVSIPVLPMADSADTSAAPSPTNNVVESANYVGNNPVASPIVSGIRTSIGSSSFNLRTYDLTLANRTVPTLSTLVVAWNDRNLGATSGVLAGADEFDENELACSTSVSLPAQLNLLYVPAYAPSATPASGSLLASTTTTGGDSTVNTLCPVFGNHAQGGVSGSGFLKLYQQNPGGTVTQSSMYAFSIPFINSTSTNYDVYSATWLSHDRGNFSSR